MQKIVCGGVVCFRKHNNQYQVLMVQKKYTYGYITLITGSFNPFLWDYKELEDIAEFEKSFLNTNSFDDLFKSILSLRPLYFGDKMNENFIHNFTFLCKRVQIEKGMKLHEYIAQISCKRSFPLWEIPKGQKYGREHVKDCAIREFYEETRNSLSTSCFLDIAPVSSQFVKLGPKRKQFDTYYYGAIDETALDYLSTYYSTPEQQKEILACRWFYTSLLDTIDTSDESLRVINYFLHSF